MSTRTEEIRKQIAGLESLIAHETDTSARALYERKLATLQSDLASSAPDRDLGDTIYQIVKSVKTRYEKYRPQSQEAFCIDIGQEARAHLVNAGWLSPKDAKRTTDFAKAMGRIRTQIIRELKLPSHVSDEEFVRRVVQHAQSETRTSSSGDYLSEKSVRGGRLTPGLRPITDMLDVALYQESCDPDSVFGPDRDGEYWKIVMAEGKGQRRFGWPDRCIAVTLSAEKLLS